MCGRVYGRESRGASGIAAGFFTIVACNIAGCFFNLLKDIQILISGGNFGGFFFFFLYGDTSYMWRNLVRVMHKFKDNKLSSKYMHHPQNVFEYHNNE